MAGTVGKGMRSKLEISDILADVILPEQGAGKSSDDSCCCLLSVSIVTYNTSLEELGRCLACLDDASVAEIVIWDNSSSVKLRDFCSGFAKVKYIQSANIGYGPGNNGAFLNRSVKTPYHLVINSDIEFDPHVLRHLIKVMALNPWIGLLQPKIVDGKGVDKGSLRLLPTPLDLFSRRFLPKRLFRKKNARYLLDSLDKSLPMRLPYFQGSFLLFKSEDFEKSGMFDKRFFMYPEDIDISRRFFDSGKTLYYPYAVIRHLHRQESYKNMKMTRIHVVNMIKYFNKWGWLFDRRRKEVNRAILSLVRSERSD